LTSEQIGKVAGGVVDGLKQQPALLVIVVLNVVMIVSQVWETSSVNAARGEAISKLIEQCSPHKEN
jgi:hypothetical protein